MLNDIYRKKKPNPKKTENSVTNPPLNGQHLRLEELGSGRTPLCPGVMKITLKAEVLLRNSQLHRDIESSWMTTIIKISKGIPSESHHQLINR